MLTLLRRDGAAADLGRAFRLWFRIGEFAVIIDIHAHATDTDFLDWVAATPGLGPSLSGNARDGYVAPGYGPIDMLLYDLDGRLESLERRGVELQLFGPTPTVLSTMTSAAGLALAEAANRATARVVDRAGGRMRGLVALPLGEPDQIERHLLDQLATGRFAGVALPSSAAGEPLDLPKFARLWELLAKHDLFAFMHSTGAVKRPSLDDYSLATLIQYPTETAISVARLVFAGVFERHPGLKLALSHGGGSLPFLAGRIDLGYLADGYERNPECSASISRKPSTYMKQLYFDTLVSGAEALRMLVDWAGPDHVLFGSDFPYEIGDPEGGNSLPIVATFDPATAEKIRRGNARRLLNL